MSQAPSNWQAMLADEEQWIDCCTNHKDLLIAAWRNSKMLLKIDGSEDAM